MKKWWGFYLRYPRTTQERRANQDKNDTLIRGHRRNLPTAYDDIFIHKDNCWKSRRKTQYRPADSDYAWHEFHFSWGDLSRMTMRNITDRLDELGCWYEYNNTYRWSSSVLRWFGPDMGV
jgi:hypothetical protein